MKNRRESISWDSVNVRREKTHHCVGINFTNRKACPFVHHRFQKENLKHVLEIGCGVSGKNTLLSSRDVGDKTLSGWGPFPLWRQSSPATDFLLLLLQNSLLQVFREMRTISATVVFAVRMSRIWARIEGERIQKGVHEKNRSLN